MRWKWPHSSADHRTNRAVWCLFRHEAGHNSLELWGSSGDPLWHHHIGTKYLRTKTVSLNKPDKPPIDLILHQYIFLNMYQADSIIKITPYWIYSLHLCHFQWQVSQPKERCWWVLGDQGREPGPEQGGGVELGQSWGWTWKLVVTAIREFGTIGQFSQGRQEI